MLNAKSVQSSPGLRYLHMSALCIVKLTNFLHIPAYERGGVHHRPSLGALTFLPPRPAPAPAAASARAASDRPPPPGRPPVPVKSERARGKPKAKVYSHYACPAAVQLPDFNQAVPDMCELREREGG